MDCRLGSIQKAENKARQARLAVADYGRATSYFVPGPRPPMIPGTVGGKLKQFSAVADVERRLRISTVSILPTLTSIIRLDLGVPREARLCRIRDFSSKNLQQNQRPFVSKTP